MTMNKRQRSREQWARLAFSVLIVQGLGGAGGRVDTFPAPTTVADGAKLAEIYGDDRFFEGPTWDPSTRKLYFTAFGRGGEQILRLDAPGKVAVWMDQTKGINGTHLSTDGRLLGAQVSAHCVTDYGFGPNGPSDPKTLLHDPSLHQPNDLSQAPNGDIYFSDPEFKDRKTSAVYLLR